MATPFRDTSRKRRKGRAPVQMARCLQKLKISAGFPSAKCLGTILGGRASRRAECECRLGRSLALPASMSRRTPREVYENKARQQQLCT